MNERNSELKANEVTIWTSNKIVEQTIKDPKTGVESTVHYNVPVQGTMNLGKNEQKRNNVKLGKTGNPKKTYTH